ncbi:MAG TPA: hypothetical protein VHH73_19740, partial [Verrucomicrobiae bacterium]|nr:hypothetical protein [Verrucomicrobiae bacterium]
MFSYLKLARGEQLWMFWLLVAGLLGQLPLVASQLPPPGKYPALSRPAKKPQSDQKKESRAELNTGILLLTKTAPAEIRPGEEFAYELKVTALVAAGNIQVEDQLPEGAKHVRSEPSAEVNDRDLLWKFRLLNQGESRTIKVWLKAEQEGTF